MPLGRGVAPRALAPTEVAVPAAGAPRARPLWTGDERNAVALDRLNARLLLDDDPMTLALVGAGDGAAPEGAVGEGAQGEGAQAVSPPAGGAGRERMLVGESGPAASLAFDTLAGGREETLDVVNVLATGPARVPPLSAVAIGLCVAVTVVLGFWPGPLTAFAHHATLLFQR